MRRWARLGGGPTPITGAAGLDQMHYSRGMEEEADQFGVDLLLRSPDERGHVRPQRDHAGPRSLAHLLAVQVERDVPAGTIDFGDVSVGSSFTPGVLRIRNLGPGRLEYSASEEGPAVDDFQGLGGSSGSAGPGTVSAR